MESIYFEKVPVVLGHSGLNSQIDQAIECAAHNSNVYLETSGMYYQHKILEAINHPDIGVERILYGSDLPSLDPTVEMMKILSLPISISEKKLVLWKNAKSLFVK